MEEKELKKVCLNLMETTGVVYLSTIDSDGFPYTRIMSNLRNKKEHPGLVELMLMPAFAKGGYKEAPFEFELK